MRKRVAPRLAALLLALLLCLAPLTPAAQAKGMSTLGTMKTIDVGDDCCAAIDAEGNLWTWGKNEYGTVGNGTTQQQDSPCLVLRNVVSVSLGPTQTAAIRADGTLWMWGQGMYGELCAGQPVTEPLTVPLPMRDRVAAVSVGRSNTALLTENGDLYVCGANARGQVGNGGEYDTVLQRSYGSSSVPQASIPLVCDPVKVLENVVSFSAGDDVCAAIDASGDLWVWGDNMLGSLGIRGGDASWEDTVNTRSPDGTLESYTETFYYQTVPTRLMSGVRWVNMNMCCAGKEDGTVWAWGKSSLLSTEQYDYQTRSYGTYCSRPALVLPELQDVVWVDGSLFLLADNSLWCKGCSLLSPRADGLLWTNGNLFSPSNSRRLDYSETPVKIMDGVAQLSAPNRWSSYFGNHFLQYGTRMIQKEDGSVWVWGQQENGMLGTGAPGNIPYRNDARDEDERTMQTIPVELFRSGRLPTATPARTTVYDGYRPSLYAMEESLLAMGVWNPYPYAVRGYSGVLLCERDETGRYVPRDAGLVRYTMNAESEIGFLYLFTEEPILHPETDAMEVPDDKLIYLDLGPEDAAARFLSFLQMACAAFESPGDGDAAMLDPVTDRDTAQAWLYRYCAGELDAAPEETPDFVFTTASENLRDVLAPHSWAVEETDLSRAAGLLTAHTYYHFRLNITRSQFAELLVNLVEKVTGKAIAPSPADTFTDTSDEVIRKAHATGVVKGMGNGTFAPDALADRQQIAAMICRAIRYLECETGKTYLTQPSSIEGFGDKALVKSWFVEEVGAMAANGIMQGDGVNLMAEDPCTVEQCVLLIWRFYQKTL